MYFKWKSYKKKMVQKKSGGNKTLTKSSRRKTKRNKFMTAKGERADEDEEGGAGESQLDAARADIDSKYNNLPTWVTDASGEPLPSPNNNNQDESTSWHNLTRVWPFLW